VLPALQQGTIDGSFSAVPVFTTFQYQEVARYVTETGQAYIFSVAMLSRRWFDGLPADLQGQVMAAARQAETEVTPWGIEFFAAQRKVWIDKGGEMVVLPAADKAEIMTKLAPVGEDIVRTKPVLKPLWEQMVATAKRSN
jgi:TRAP-type C4-dicarboxylate transport system substrate-binding protein